MSSNVEQARTYTINSESGGATIAKVCSSEVRAYATARYELDETLRLY